jgi:hypothetical protein
MRYQFNAMGFDERVAGGELDIVVIERRRPASPAEDLRGAESQLVQYVEHATGEILAECQRFYFVAGRRRGQLGASGRPDPKWLLVDDEGWNLRHGDDEECDDCAVWRPRVSAQLAEGGADGGTR